MSRTKEEQRAYQKAWRLAHPEARKKEIAREKERRATDPEYRAKHNAMCAKYRANNIEALRETQKKSHRKKYLAIKADPVAYAELVNRQRLQRIAKLETI